MSAPTITVISMDSYGARYRVEGGELAPDWAKTLRDGKTAWCEVSIPEGRTCLSSYGGEVWPLAWPTLFRQPILPAGAVRVSPSTVELTEAGVEALREAREEFGRQEFLANCARDCNCCGVCWERPCGACQAGGVCDAMPCRCDEDREPSEDDSDSRCDDCGCFDAECACVDGPGTGTP